MSSMLKPGSYIRSRTNSAASIKSNSSASKDKDKSQLSKKKSSSNLKSVQDGYAEEKVGKDWKPRPGHSGNLNPSQKEVLANLMSELSREGALLLNPNQDQLEQQEIHLLRFLRARSWSVQPAKEMFLKALEWKRVTNLDALVGDGEGKWKFEEREEVAKSGWRMYFHKTDKLGRPIFVQNLANINTTQVFQKTTPERIINEFAVTLEKAIRYRYRASTEVAGHLIEDNLMILNIEGLGLGTFWSFKNQLQGLLGILDANYPELSGRVQIINAPWIFATVWGTLKGWLPVGTVEKIDIAGSDYQSILLEFVEPENLPLSMGGTCTCPHSKEGGCETSDEGPWIQFLENEKFQKEEEELERRKNLELKELAPSHSKPELLADGIENEVDLKGQVVGGSGMGSGEVNGIGKVEHGREFLEKDRKDDEGKVEDKLKTLEV